MPEKTILQILSDKNELMAVIFHLLIAAFGGLANALSSGHRKFVHLFSHMIVASFTGGIAAMIAVSVFETEQIYFTGAIAGSFGYAGKEGMIWIIEAIKRAIEVNIKRNGK